MEILLSSWYEGNPETGIHYRLFTAPMYDNQRIYGILRDYGEKIDGTPNTEVTLLWYDDGTVECFQRAYSVFRMFVN